MDSMDRQDRLESVASQWRAFTALVAFQPANLSIPSAALVPLLELLTETTDTTVRICTARAPREANDG